MNVLPGKYLHAELGYCYRKTFLQKFYSPFHVIRDTDPRTECAWAWVLTEARSYHTYMHSTCQFGSLGPQSSGPQSPGPLNIVSPLYGMFASIEEMNYR